MAYQPINSVVEGGKRSILSKDDEERDILYSLLKELKVMNLHLSILTDTQITKQDTE